MLHMLILSNLCLFKPICGAFEAEEKNSRREALLCRARGTYICSQELKKTAGHVTMSDYNLLMSVKIKFHTQFMSGVVLTNI